MRFPLPLDTARLAALMGMTDSAHDGEALNAVRMANRLLRQSGRTWADVLTEAAPPQPPPQASQQPPPPPTPDTGRRCSGFISLLAALLAPIVGLVVLALVVAIR
jgi:hypothetical protein